METGETYDNQHPAPKDGLLWTVTLVKAVCGFGCFGIASQERCVVVS